MQLRHAENYNIGLDLGTGSVGWAVTDENGELYHFKKQPTWGSRLFPSANTAAEARVHRGQRRRYDRRRQRLDLLQDFFLEPMASVDPEFFIRLRQSQLWPQDRDPQHAAYHWPLFNDEDFNECDYYKKFPTIYHLRVWLMETDEQADVRLVYLALHNIVKTRGNFLHQDNERLSAKNANMKESVDRLCSALAEWMGEVDPESSCEPKPEKLRAVLEDVSLSRGEMRDKGLPFLGLETDAAHKRIAKQVIGAVLGYKADLKKVFFLETDDPTFDLSNDAAVEEFRSSVPDEGAELFDSLLAAHSSFILQGILKGGDGRTISYCKVNEYEQYGKDLRELKDLVRQYAPTRYDEFFRGPHYEGACSKDYDPSKAKGYTLYNLGTTKLSYDDFASQVKKLFKGTGAESDERYIKMMGRFDEQTFLRRLKTSDNGSIPFQLHLEEMKAIIANQGRYYPFLKKHEKEIESLVTFRIPYYVGPLTQKNAAVAHGEPRFAWSVRNPGKENTPIRPWNWEEVIDKHASAAAFIQRMTGTCTYLQGEPVLPRASLLYEKFCVLNELNGARWSQDGDDWHRFSYDLRARIFDELFTRGTVTYKKIEHWLRSENIALNAHVKGGQGETGFESKLGSYLFFKKVLGIDDFDAQTIEMIENLVLWNTLFEDRDILKEGIQRHYGDVLSPSQIRQICKKRFTGWGRLSKKFLTGITVPTDNGAKSIMDVLEEGDPNNNHPGAAMVLMEALHDDNLGFEKAIAEANKAWMESHGKLGIDEIPGSPALRRSVNQALKIVDEIVSIAGCAPANIYIETTRDDDVDKRGKRTKKRYDAIKEALKKLGAEADADLKKDLASRSYAELDTERLALYFMQNGKSLYSGAPLDIRKLSSYQVDHIIPQSYTKDDSFENKALVLAEENQRKTDSLLLSDAIRRKMAPTWRALHDAGLMGEKKFNNLMRSHISNMQMKGFINRQIVETSQVVKFVRTMLQERYPETNVRSIKASLSHQLRVRRGLVKSRIANDFHHAHDAYLAEEMGRFIELRHSIVFDNPVALQHVIRKYIQEQAERYAKTKRLPEDASFIVQSFLTSGFSKETGEIFRDTWDADAEVARIKKFMNYRQCFISRMPIEETGTFWDATIYSPKGGRTKPTIPLKGGLDPARYGGYSSLKNAYFFVYRAEGSKGRVLRYAGVPVSVASRIKRGDLVLSEYAEQLARNEGLAFEAIVRRKILQDQLIEIDGERFYIRGNKEVRNAIEPCFSLAEAEAIEADDPTGYEAVLDEAFGTLLRFLHRYATRQEGLLRIEERARAFYSLNEEGKQQIICEILNLVNAQKNVANLKLINGPSFAGKIQLTLSKELSSNSTTALIDQSVTGMFERRQEIGL
ncbi:type II CRISPR RNA-guided endonuclease Cas9 [Hugonella massiliensis]|uniref:type II CRISPR RNA-guided endonuclease Cas9 n=1 Tax=Hugonella massiliensis TaxID=1720315 RepID=UPI00073E77A3|nr:type II CRISPR RNA-guided endonuclease Cas9 [Hugonella massiliensis]